MGEIALNVALLGFGKEWSKKFQSCASCVLYLWPNTGIFCERLPNFGSGVESSTIHLLKKKKLAPICFSIVVLLRTQCTDWIDFNEIFAQIFLIPLAPHLPFLQVSRIVELKTMEFTFVGFPVLDTLRNIWILWTKCQLAELTPNKLRIFFSQATFLTKNLKKTCRTI